MHIGWTKQQDFCLRLGLLKALVAVLPGQRRSASREVILRKLDQVLFAPAGRQPGLLASAARVLGSELPPDATVADSLLMTSTCSSWGQPIDGNPSKIAKVLEWGHNAGLMAAGNQITERGLLLRSFFPEDELARFLAGDASAWNPFTLSRGERGFLFYHLGECDNLLWYLAARSGELGAGRALEAADAHRLTYEGMTKLLAHLEKHAPISEMPRVRQIRELAAVIGAEVDRDGTSPPPAILRRAPPKRPRPGQRSSHARKTVKNADHQAIPRFEMLTDLGFLEKRVGERSSGKDLDRARRGWTFVVTEAAAKFAKATEGASFFGGDWQWTGFSRAFAESGLAAAGPIERATASSAMQVFASTYASVHRMAGHSPFESVALLAMLRGLVNAGVTFEIAEVHRLVTRLKSEGTLGNHIYFAAGNEIDRMFVLLRPSFHAAVQEWLDRNLLTL